MIDPAICRGCDFWRDIASYNGCYKICHYCCYLAGYKKGTQDIEKFHNSVWKAAEREALKDGKGD